MRYAIYARYSSDRQSETSIEDQVRECRAFIENQGGTVAGVFTDYAISGSTADRPGLLDLMASAQSGQFRTVVAEALDRLSRDQENIAGVFKRLTHCRVAIHTLSEGEVSELHIGLKGTMNALFLKDLASKTRRGQVGAVERGKIPGGLSFGYTAIRGELDKKGEPIRGLRAINEDEAETIRRIFSEYAAGRSPKAIAFALNADGVASPRGKGWRTSAIYGNPKRGNGILHNRLYRGEIVYNRQSFVKDPDTGKRLARPNPEHTWVIQEAPDLRIVSPELWEAAHARMCSVSHATDQKRPKRLLSGLVKCAACGASYVARGKGRMACSSRVEKGTCKNAVHVKIDDLEARVLDALKGLLLDPELVATYVREYLDEMNRLRAHAARRQVDLQHKLALTEEAIQKAAAAFSQAPELTVLLENLRSLEADKTAMQAELNRARPSRVIPLTPALAEGYRQKVDDLNTMIQRGTIDSLAAQGSIRSLIDSVRVKPQKDSAGRAVLDLDGDLAAILAFATGTPEVIRDRMEGMVAGAGFEPATFRL